MRNSKLIKRAFRKNLATSVISIAVTGINSMLDGLLMGNLIGPKALSAINLAMPVNYVLLTVESIFAAGAAGLKELCLNGFRKPAVIILNTTDCYHWVQAYFCWNVWV